MIISAVDRIKPFASMATVWKAGRVVNASCLIGLVLATAGCTTHADRLRAVRHSFYAGDLQQANTSITEAAKKKSEQDLLHLDQAMVELFAGRPKDSEALLREVRDRFDELQEKAVTEQVASMIADDNRVAYSGEDYERILIRVMLAISNLLQNGPDAFAYAHQILDEEQKLNEKRAEFVSDSQPIEDPPSPQFGIQPAGTSIVAQAAANSETTSLPATSQLAISHYLMGMLREQTHRDYHEALRHYEKSWQCKPDFLQVQRDIERVKSSQHSQRGNGVLYVITFVGQGPYKKQIAHLPTSEALLIADRILSVTGKHSLPPTISPIKVPMVVRYKNEIDHVQVAVDAGPFVPTETIVDVSELAEQAYQREFPQIVARAVVRRVLKKAAVYQTKEFVSVHSPILEFAFDLVGVAWEASESADTRCWGLLPDRIQIARLELPAGEHSVRLQPSTISRFTPPPGTWTMEKVDVLIHDGQNTYLLANFPGEKLVGQIVTSN